MKTIEGDVLRFIMRTEMVSGDGVALTCANRARVLGWRRAGVVIDAALLKNNPYVREVVDSLTAGLESVVVVESTLPEPTYAYLDVVKNQLTGHLLDFIIGIGGGSTMDLAKGLAVLQTNSGSAIKFRGFDRVGVPPLPVVALPSTAGTGSEVTPYAVFIDTEAKWKFGINTEYNYPRLALYDPRFLDSCPDQVYASAGMDAMTHTLESFVARNATPISRIFSVKAFELLYPFLGRVADGDRSTTTKLNLLIGSSLAAAALMNSGAGPAGALSYPLGVFFKVPHGLAGSVFLPAVIEYNVRHKDRYEEYSILYDLVAPKARGSRAEKSLRFAAAIRDLSARLGIPTTLAGFGVETKKDAQLIIENSQQLKAAFEQNPVPFEIHAIHETVHGLM